MGSLFFRIPKIPRGENSPQVADITSHIIEPIKGAAVKKYGFGSFILDCLMVIITGGLWLIWIFAREMRRPKAVY